MNRQNSGERIALKRYLRISGVAAMGLIVAIYFQNCAPVGDGQGTVSSTGGAGGTIDQCPILPPPSVSNPPAAQTIRSGQGVLSGSQYVQNLSVSVQPGYAGQTIQLNCSSTGVNGLNVDCNGPNNIDISVDDEGDQANAECASGTATVRVEVEDAVCNKRGNAVTFQVTVQNTCVSNVQIRGTAGARLDQFGSAVAIDGNWAVGVAPADDQRGLDAGAAYAFRFDGTNWVMAQKLLPAALSAGDEIRSVAISGNVIAMGSPYHLNDGAVFIFRFNGTTWVESQTIRPSQVNTTLDYDLFGHAVALGGGLLAVGTPGNNHGDVVNRVEAGAVFVYQDGGATFSETNVLRASNPAARDFFGGAVAIAGSRVLVGAPSSAVANKAAYSGKAYIFTGATETRLLPTAGQIANGDDYGFSVSGTTDRVVIGAPRANGDQTDSGAAFVFRFDGTNWTQEARLQHSDGATGDEYGYSVWMGGTGVVVGAPGHNTKMGAAYYHTFVNNAWTQRFKFLPRRALRAQQDRFAESVSFSGQNFIGGSRLDDDQELNAGSAFIMRLP